MRMKMKFEKRRTIDYNNSTSQRPLKIYSIIPLNIFQTWHSLDLPTKMKENLELLKRQNPEFKHYLYDDNMCRQFIKDNFDEEVLYSFDKLKPGAYKADLWRYCVLYIHGGIYLDIKYRCRNGFKLIELTDKEYFVRDRPQGGSNGIYQALMVNLPYNSILLKAIKQIVNYCKNNTYTNFTSLCVTGPGLLAYLVSIKVIESSLLYFTGDMIVFDNNKIMEYYPGYRIEQLSKQKTSHYSSMWRTKDIYNYPILKSRRNIDFSKTKIIYNKKVYSSTLFIIEISSNKYLVNRRWINYKYDEISGFKHEIPSVWWSLNSRFYVDEDLNVISDEVFLKEKNITSQKGRGIGLEDLRIFKNADKYYYIATNSLVQQVSSSSYNISQESFELKRNIILPSFYDTKNSKRPEKNWSFVEYKNELHVVYYWHPLQLGKINYENNTLNIAEIKYDMPEYFEDARGSTPGYNHNNELWFVLHKSQMFQMGGKTHWHYQHFMAVFDTNMNLLRYSELFKLGEHPIEFCIGLIVKDKEIIMSYSLKDTESIIAIYDKQYIETDIRWYIHTRNITVN